MGLAAEFNLLHSELNDFLFAQMGEEESGAPLTVLSALTRLGVDPWAEAARLSALPKRAAAQALAPMIAMFPRQTHGASEAAVLAEHLAWLLPQRIERVTSIPTGDGQAAGWQAAWNRLGGWGSGLARIAREQQWSARLSMPAWFAVGTGVATLLLWLARSFE
jgi:hypothetical protein